MLAGFLALTLAVPVTFADSKEKDPDEIGNRDVGKGVNSSLPNGRHGVVRSFTNEAAPTVFAFNVFRFG
jgi:hypothetical protein